MRNLISTRTPTSGLECWIRLAVLGVNHRHNGRTSYSLAKSWLTGSELFVPSWLKASRWWTPPMMRGTFWWKSHARFELHRSIIIEPFEFNRHFRVLDRFVLGGAIVCILEDSLRGDRLVSLLNWDPFVTFRSRVDGFGQMLKTPPRFLGFSGISREFLFVFLCFVAPQDSFDSWECHIGVVCPRRVGVQFRVVGMCIRIFNSNDEYHFQYLHKLQYYIIMVIIIYDFITQIYISNDWYQIYDYTIYGLITI